MSSFLSCGKLTTILGLGTENRKQSNVIVSIMYTNGLYFTLLLLDTYTS